MNKYMTIFWRTFAQLALAVLLGVQGLDWINGSKSANLAQMGLGILAAFIGAVVAVLWAYGTSPATTALEKAIRSAVQSAAGGLGAVVLNQTQDFFKLGNVLLAVGVVVVFSFLITFLQYQGEAPPAMTPADK